MKKACYFLPLVVASLLLCSPQHVYAWNAADRDFDGDGRIGFTDFVRFVRAFETRNVLCDIYVNGVVAFGDFVLFSQY